MWSLMLKKNKGKLGWMKRNWESKEIECPACRQGLQELVFLLRETKERGGRTERRKHPCRQGRLQR